MLNEAQIKSVALFYFYACMDESAAFQASTKTIEKCRKRLSRGALSEDEVASVIVNSTYSYWQEAHKASTPVAVSLSRDGSYVSPPGLDLGAWQEFRKNTDEDEFLAVVWSKLLDFSDGQIAQGLGVTVGTVRHRVGRGLRRLGQILKLKKKDA